MRHTLPLLASIVLALGAGCVEEGTGTYVRGSQAPGIDQAAMGTGMDKHDIAQALHDNLQSLMSSPVAAGWAATRSMPVLAVYPLTNDTSEHIDSQLNALLSDAETYLVNSGLVKVVSVERQGQMMDELAKQHGGGFDPRYMERSRQLGAKYYLTGKVFNSDERTDDARRVQYFMFMQLIEVGTSAVVWQNKMQFTKALVRVD
jgi:uncharacterized protein (TIGR02722 family)